MKRTQTVFYIVVAICLVIIAISLGTQALSEARLLQIFVAATVFAAGVVALDFFGVLGHHGGDSAGHDTGTDATAGHDFGGHDLAAHDVGGHDLAAHDLADHGGAGHAADAAAGDGHAAAAHDVSHDSAHDAAQQASHAAQNSAAPILSVLSYLRLFVYFCLGFGPAGWVAMAVGWGAWRSLVLAVPVGAGSLLLARAFFRFQRRDTGAVMPNTDLVSERATVIVSLNAHDMGKVRVQTGMTVTDLYALAEDAGAAFQEGDSVRIIRVTDDCVYVR